jgi:head-tail adaptor
MDVRAASPLRAHHRLTLHAPEGTRNSGSPADLASGVRAQITALTIQERERLGLGGLTSQTVYIIRMAYRSDVDTDLILVEECCSQRRFQIVNMVPSDRNERLEITAVVGDRSNAV